jgi:predicted metal-binding protein
MMDIEYLKSTGKEAGFSVVAPLDADTISIMPDVRGMCKSGNCGVYGKKWSCPPACGTLEECEKKVRGYHKGILVQTIGQLEDEFDGEGMIETESRHKENFFRMHDILISRYPQMLSLGAGCCTRCKICTYPDAPCRFPEKKFSSMEAFGMLVTQVCTDNGVKYYYGPGTIAYTSCFLLE